MISVSQSNIKKFDTWRERHIAWKINEQYCKGTNKAISRRILLKGTAVIEMANQTFVACQQLFNSDDLYVQLWRPTQNDISAEICMDSFKLNSSYSSIGFWRKASIWEEII